MTIRSGSGDDKIDIANEEGWNMNWQLTEYDTSVFIGKRKIMAHAASPVGKELDRRIAGRRVGSCRLRIR